MANAALEDEILRLEEAFWDAMVNRDGEGVSSLTSANCVVANSAGVAIVAPALVGQMLANASWTLDSYAIEGVRLQELDEDTAVIAYKVTEQLKIDGQPLTLTAFDTSVWRRENGRWTCALHTESLAGDPFGRDRRESSA